MKWINFLHLYQRANAEAYAIEEASEKSYTRIVRAIEEHPKVKFTLNINGCLLFRLSDLKQDWLIKRIKELVRKGRIELTGNASYHPLLPLVPLNEIRKQVIETEENFRNHFGDDVKMRGFFMSEMAYSKEAAKLLFEMGYEWIILDEIAYNGKLGEVDISKIYKDKNSGLKVVFRSREKSSKYIPDYIIKNIDKDEVLVTGSDAELYGLRHEDPTGEFEKCLKLDKLETETISEFVDRQEIAEEVEIVNCSWESQEDELAENRPYILWNDPKKKIHQKMWELSNLVIEAEKDFCSDENCYWLRWHLVRGLASCSFWWASGKDFSHNFGPLAWNPDEVERGVNELIRAVRALEDEDSRGVKIEAEKLYIEIKQLVWAKHWTDFWKK